MTSIAAKQFCLKKPYHHVEGAHPCIVEPGSSPGLRVRCNACGGAMRADLLSHCLMPRATDRVLLFVRCAACGAIGQLRFLLAAFVLKSRLSAEQLTTATWQEGQAGYLNAGCNRHGGAPVVQLRGHVVDDGRLVLLCRVGSCGEDAELSLPAAPEFRVQAHHC